MAECSQQTFDFHCLNSRPVQGVFNGGSITSDAGALLLLEVERRTDILRQFAACFTDHRDPKLLEHRLPELLSQRVYGLALGYEDLNDHDQLRADPLLALLADKADLTGIDASKGALEEVQRIVARLRQSWPQVRIVLRGDSGFCREEIMAWRQAKGVYFIFGLAKNERLKTEIVEQLAQAKALFEQSGQAARVFKEFMYQTRESWSCPRRVVGKAEYLEKGENPRFVVANIPATEQDGPTLYAQTYCARGEMENRIKEQQLYLFADRTRTASMRANQLRLWLSSVAYLLMHALRRLGLKETELAQAQCQTIRLKLLKIGALIRVSARRVWLAMAESYPYKEIFACVYRNLQALPLRC